MKPKRYVVITQQVEGNTESGFDTYYYSDLKLFDDRKQAISHGFKMGRSDDFNVATIKGGRLVAFGWMERDFIEDRRGEPHGGYDLAEIERQTYMRERWSS